MRWSIEGRGLPTVTSCAESGMFELRARAYAAPNQVVGEVYVPCSAAAVQDGGTVDGSPLPPGRYAIELRGVDRADNTWEDPSLAPLDPDEIHNGCNAVNDYTECRPTELVCDCLELEVDDEDSTVTLPEFVLEPPPECVDGIDNDRDGLIDSRDPACAVDGGIAGEGIAVGLTEMRIALSFLSENPNANCSSVRGGNFLVRVASDAGQTDVLDATCGTDIPYLASLRVPAGTYTFSASLTQQFPPSECASVEASCASSDLTAAQCVENNPTCFAETCETSLAECEADGLDDAGCQSLHPECYQANLLTRPKTFVRQINATGGSIAEAIDFAAEDFIEPVVGAINIDPQFVSALGLEDIDGDPKPVDTRTTCIAQPEDPDEDDAEPGTLNIPTLRMTMLNAHGGTVDEPVILDGTPVDGRERACAAVYLTDSVQWGGYSLATEGLADDGTVCFQNVGNPTPMRPTVVLGVPMARVYEPIDTVDENGDPTVVMRVPDSCRECEVQADCGAESQWHCLDGVCQLPCEANSNCESTALGDLGFECQPVPDRSANYCVLPPPTR